MIESIGRHLDYTRQKIALGMAAEKKKNPAELFKASCTAAAIPSTPASCQQFTDPNPHHQSGAPKYEVEG